MARIQLVAFLTYEFRRCYPTWIKLSLRRRTCLSDGSMCTCLPGFRSNPLGGRNDQSPVSKGHSEASSIPVFLECCLFGAPKKVSGTTKLTARFNGLLINRDRIRFLVRNLGLMTSRRNATSEVNSHIEKDSEIERGRPGRAKLKLALSLVSRSRKLLCPIELPLLVGCVRVYKSRSCARNREVGQGNPIQ